MDEQTIDLKLSEEMDEREKRQQQKWDDEYAELEDTPCTPMWEKYGSFVSADVVKFKTGERETLMWKNRFYRDNAMFYQRWNSTLTIEVSRLRKRIKLVWFGFALAVVELIFIGILIFS